MNVFSVERTGVLDHDRPAHHQAEDRGPGGCRGADGLQPGDGQQVQDQERSGPGRITLGYGLTDVFLSRIFTKPWRILSAVLGSSVDPPDRSR